MQALYLEQLRAEMGKAVQSIALDLGEVTLVDIDVVHFLCRCESQGIELRHCALYIREWILRENARNEREF